MSLLAKTLHSVGWVLGGRQVQQVAALVFTAVLAKLLMPEDFGLVAMASVIAGLAMLLSDTGFSSVIIQNQQIGQRHYSTLFWLNLCFGVAVSLLFYSASPLIAAFYQRDELIEICQVLSANFILASLSTVPKAIMKKQMQFKLLTMMETAIHLVAGAVAIGMALMGYGVWSLVAQLVIVQGLKGPIAFIVCRWLPSWLFSWSALREVIRYCSSVMGTQYLHYLIQNLHVVLIGRFLGAEVAGYFSLAQKIMLVPIRNVCLEVVKVLFPAFSKIQHDRERLAAAFLRALRSVSYVVVPMLLGMCMVAEPFVLTLFGSDWAPAVEVLQMLCLLGLIQSAIAVTGFMFRAMDRPELELKINLIRLLVMTIVLIGLIQYGLVVYISGAMVIAAAFLGALLYFLGPMLQLTGGNYLRAVCPPVMISLTMMLVLFAFDSSAFVLEMSHLQQLILLVGLGGLFYLAVVATQWWFYRRNNLTLF